MVRFHDDTTKLGAQAERTPHNVSHNVNTKDVWNVTHEAAVRQHYTPRRQLFTPLRVVGAPAVKELTPYRKTTGEFLNGEKFKRAHFKVGIAKHVMSERGRQVVIYAGSMVFSRIMSLSGASRQRTRSLQDVVHKLQAASENGTVQDRPTGGFVKTSPLIDLFAGRVAAAPLS